MKNKLTKRTLRNIIMVLMIVALGAGAYFTMDNAAEVSASNSISSGMHGDFKEGHHSKSTDSSDSSNDSNSSDSSSGESNQPPEMPSGDSSQQNGQPPEMPSGDSSQQNGQPPEMPSGDSSQQNGQPPEMPSSDGSQQGNPIESFNSENGSESSDGTETAESTTDSTGKSNRSKPDGMPSDMKGRHSKSNKISTIYYVVFAAESALIALILIYLIMSGFNKKGFRETLKGWKRVVIYALSVVIVSGCLTVIEGEVTKKCLMNSSFSEMERGNFGGNMQGGSNGSGTQTSVDANGATTVDGNEQTLSESYTSTVSDESAILVTNGGSATVSGAKISKSGASTNTENSEFYGVNSAVLVQSGSTATIKDAEITTDAKGANAVFATGEDAKIYISNSTVTSTGASSARGLDATYGGYIEADNVTVTTQGGSCASLATDRGEGTVIAKNSTLETNGKGSPVIYSTGDITVENTKGTANGSQMVVVEGKNTATVTSSTLTASAAGNRGDVDIAGVMLYQSMSGDASEGTATFTATDSTLEIQSASDYYKSAPMFFVTNTDAVINLKNTKLVYGSGVLLNAAGTSEWGKEGSNGGNVTLNAESQSLEGNITADSISTVAINLTSSTYEGTINGENSAKEIALKLDKSSKIKLTGDSYVTSLDDADSTYSNIDFNGFTLYVNGKAIN